MPVRIYSLAKELKLDSKELVTMCAKAGIQGKGSALASLDDDELAKLKSYIAGGNKTTTKKKPDKNGKSSDEQGVVKREDYIAVGSSNSGKLKVLPPTTSKALASTIVTESEPSSEAIDAPLIDEPQELPETEKVAAKKISKLSPLRPKPRPLAPAIKPKEKKPKKDSPSRPASPSVRLAPMPAKPEPKRGKKSDEPTPQKPDIKLPADARRAAKEGSKAGLKPLSNLLRKHEEKRKTDEKSSKGRRGQQEKPADSSSVDSATARVRGKRGKGGRPEEADADKKKTLLDGRARRQLQRKRTGRKQVDGEDGTPSYRRPRRIRRSTGKNTAAPRKGKVTVEFPCSVRAFSEAVGIQAAQVLRVLMQEGHMATINAQLDLEQAELISIELGLDETQFDIIEKKSVEQIMLSDLEDQEDTPESLETRPPIITFLGHVDHGKTSLLDKIIGIDVVSGESGGITQHIRAYQVDHDGKKISFVDTPGHEAFTEMRARGANVTDIAVLVIAGDDGIMPQTEEAISHAKAADVPIVVALNKMDLPGVNIDRIYQQLAQNELIPAEWSPDGVEVIKTSAITGEGVDELIETLLLTAEIHELKANPNRTAIGTCIEAHQEQGRGVVAKMIVQKGTMKVGDIVVCGASSGRVQAMFDTLKPNLKIKAAGPSMPVNITGLDTVPGAGDHFHVLDDIAKAREVAASREIRLREASLAVTESHVTLENLFEKLGQHEVETLNLIIRADVRGSIEAIRNELGKLQHDEVQVKILQALVGGISEADVQLAHASNGIIVGFNVVADEAARMLAEKCAVDIRRYEIIYKLTEDIKQALEGKLKPEQRDVDLGRALVQQVFSISKLGTVAGCRVIGGTIERNCQIRVIRENRIIGDYSLETLRREKDDTKEVRDGMECGIKLKNYNDIKEGDILEAYKIEEIARTL